MTSQGRYGWRMSQSGKRHPFRKLALLAAIVGGVVAFRNAVADKGGSYDPADGAR